MEIVYLLLPISIFLAFVGLCGYLWAVKNGQFEDMDTPAKRVLLDGSCPEKALLVNLEQTGESKNAHLRQ